MNTLLLWIRKILHICDHDWVLSGTISEQNLRAGFNHDSDIYRCTKCLKCETRIHEGS